MIRVYCRRGPVVTVARNLGLLPLFLPLAAAAQSAVVATGNTSTHISVASTGATVVNIAAPNKAGLSHNRYDRFNVDTAGLVLDNVAHAVSVILNEVGSANATQLRGATAVHGTTADVMIANPSGITCSGCSFVNTDRVVLTTGAPQIDEHGAVEAFVVRQGTVTVDEGGMDASGQKMLDIIARAINIEGDVQAQALSLHAGSGEDAVHRHGTAPERREPAERMISSALVGGAHGDRIRLSASRLGVGVHGPSQERHDVESDGGLNAPGSEGRLRVVRRIAATGDVSLTGGAISNTGRIESKGDIRVLGRSFVNRGDVAADGHVLVSATAIINGLKHPQRAWASPSHRRTFKLQRPSVMSRLSFYEPVEHRWQESQTFAVADRIQTPVISAGKTMRLTFFAGKNIGGRLQSAGAMSLTGLGRGPIAPVFRNDPLLLETRHFVERAWRPRGWLRLFMPQRPFYQAGMPPSQPVPEAVEARNTLEAGIRAPELRTTDFELDNTGGVKQSGNQAGIVTDRLIVGKVADADMHALKREEIPPLDADAEMLPVVSPGGSSEGSYEGVATLNPA